MQVTLCGKSGEAWTAYFISPPIQGFGAHVLHGPEEGSGKAIVSLTYDRRVVREFLCAVDEHIGAVEVYSQEENGITTLRVIFRITTTEIGLVRRFTKEAAVEFMRDLGNGLYCLAMIAETEFPTASLAAFFGCVEDVGHFYIQVTQKGRQDDWERRITEVMRGNPLPKSLPKPGELPGGL